MSSPTKTSLLVGNGTTADRLGIVATELKEGHYTLSNKLRTCNYDGRCVSVIKSILSAIGISVERTSSKAVAKRMERFIRENQDILLGPTNKANRENCKIILDQLKLHSKDQKAKYYDECIRILYSVPEAKSTTETTTSKEPPITKQKEPTITPKPSLATQETHEKEVRRQGDPQIEKFYGIEPSSQDLVELKKLLPEYTRKLKQDYSSKNSLLFREEIELLNNSLKLAIQADCSEGIRNMLEIAFKLKQMNQNDLIQSGARQAIKQDNILFFKEFDDMSPLSYPNWAVKTEDGRIMKDLWDQTLNHKSFKMFNYLIDKQHFFYFIFPSAGQHILSNIALLPFEDFKIFIEPIIKKAPQLLSQENVIGGGPLTFYLIEEGKKESLMWLLNNFDGLPLVDSHGLSALWMAVEDKDSELAEFLITKDTNGLAWKDDNVNGIDGIKSTDTAEEVIAKMKLQIEK